MNKEVLDLVIIGSGPAGLTASLYATRAMLNAVTLELMSVGGQVVTTTEIDNYPGVPNTDGFTLTSLMHKQAEDLGATIKLEGVKSIEKDSETGLFTIHCDSQDILTKTVIVATGATPRHAGFKGEEEFSGRGVSYCGNCDAMFYRGKDVYVIGGGNTACEEALFLSNVVNHVTMVVRKDHMRAQLAMQEKIAAKDNIDIMYNTSIVSASGNFALSSIEFRDNLTQNTHTEEFEEGSKGIFVFVGHTPVVDVLGDLVDYSPSNAVITDEWMKTKTDGLFCAGDIRECPIRQIVTACADGAIAATAAAAYLGQNIIS